MLNCFWMTLIVYGSFTPKADGYSVIGGSSMEEKRLLTAKEAAAYLRISLFTLRKIEQQGLIIPYRTPGGHRRYSLEMLNEYLEKSRIPPQ
jgi:excisionase family DNA binding protein